MSVWRGDIVANLRTLAGVEGKTPSEPPIVSMGSVNPPLIEAPCFILDHIISDGAQVTRPSIDPYREPTETEVYLFGAGLRLAMPIIISGLNDIEPKHVSPLIHSCFRMGVGVHLEGSTAEEIPVDVRRFVLLEAEHNTLREIDGGPTIIRIDDREALVKLMKTSDATHLSGQLAARVPSTAEPAFYSSIVDAGFRVIIVDEDLGGEEPLEIALSEVDQVLKGLKVEGTPARYEVGLLAAASRIRSSSDVFKLGGLGADACIIRDAWKIAVDYRSEIATSLLSERLENLLIGMQREIKLLMGAAGVSAFQSSIVGNRELFRSIDLPLKLTERLGVKPAGE